MTVDYSVFNKVILFTVESYLSKSVKEGITKEDMHRKLVSGIKSFMTMRRFSKSESELIIELGNHEVIQRLKKQDIAHVVYAMELMRLWVTNVPKEVRKNIYLGVGNKKLLSGRAYFAMSMLRIKQTDKKAYDEKKQIIDESVLTAKHYYSFFEEQLLKG